MSKRKVFRKLKDLDVALNDFYKIYPAKPLGIEEVDITNALGRVLAEDVFSDISVPPFDKSIVDGYAVRAVDTFRAGETNPVKLKVIERIRTGHPPKLTVVNGVASEIDTGGMVPPGADAIVPIEYAEEKDGYVYIYRKVAPGSNIMFSGTDMAFGELVLSKGVRLTARDIGMLAAIGRRSVRVYRKPKVAIFSIGDELLEPGEELEAGKIYDVNLFLLYNAVRERGGEPLILGIAKDDPGEVVDMIKDGLEKADLVLSTGSTSAGTSDIVYRVIEEFPGPGIIAHGLKISPGKPTVISIIKGKPYFGLPGNPSSAINTFNLIVGPLIEKLSGALKVGETRKISAIAPFRINGEVGRMIIQGVSVLKRENKYYVYPIRSGSGAVRTLGSADGFIIIPPTMGYVDEGETVTVSMLTETIQEYDFVLFAPPSPKLDRSIVMAAEKTRKNVKRIRANSIVSLQAFAIGEADFAGLAMIDPGSGKFNEHLLGYYDLPDDTILVNGFRREVGLVYSREKIGGKLSLKELFTGNLVFVNQASGSEGRELFEYLVLKYSHESGKGVSELKGIIRERELVVRDYLSAIAAVKNGRGDVCIAPKELVPEDLSFEPLLEESFDFVTREKFKDALLEILSSL